MTDFVLKYNLLDSNSKKEVIDFMDFLMTKELKVKKSHKANYKRRILKVSIWSDSDIDLIQGLKIE